MSPMRWLLQTKGNPSFQHWIRIHASTGQEAPLTTREDLYPWSQRPMLGSPAKSLQPSSMRPQRHQKTVQLIMRSYFWLGLWHDITRYIRMCHTCIQAKSPCHKTYGLLKPLPIGERPWSSISIDHIVELPMSEQNDVIMVTTCRLTKGGIFIPSRTTDKVEDFVELFITHVFAKHGLPCNIKILDCTLQKLRN